MNKLITHNKIITTCEYYEREIKKYLLRFVKKITNKHI